MIKKLSSFLLILAITSSTALIYESLLSKTGLFINYRLKSIDSLFVDRALNSRPLKHAKEVVIIGIDDNSLRTLNRAAPWDRAVYTVFLENLQKLNPKIVGLDFLFNGKNRDVSIDQWFAESLKKKKNVILASFFDEENYFITPLDVFCDAALGYAFVDKPYDKDSVTRHTKSVVTLAGNKTQVFSFGTWLAYAYWGLEPSGHLQLKNGSTEWSLPKNDDPKNLEKILVDADSRGSRWLSYRYKQANFHFVPFLKIITNTVPREEIEGKIVMAGSTSPLFHDIHQTPLGFMTGVTILANEMLSILDCDFIHEIPFKFQFFLVIILTLLFTFVFYRLGFVKSFLVLIFSEIMIYGVALILFCRKNILLEPFSPMFVVGACYIITVFYNGVRIVIENIALQKMAITDSLTGLYGHHYLSFRLEAEFNRHKDTRGNFCVVMIDVDLFKQVNDTHGHEVGNTVLVAVAKILKSGVRGYDLAARYGGEEFALILLRVEEDIAYQTIERIRSAIAAQKFYSPQGEFHVTISAGVCLNRNPEVRSKDDMIRLADQALYQAKSQGRDQTCVYKAKI